LLTERARAVAIELIETLAPQGHCEFVGDFAKVLPVVVFLGMLDLPEEDRSILLPLADTVIRTSDKDIKTAAYKEIAEYLMAWIKSRTEQPGSDLLSKIATASVKGRPITTDEIFGLCSLLLVGGLDTVANMLSFIALYLAEHPDTQREIRDKPEMIPGAIEELMRRHGLPNTSRVVNCDLEYNGIQFKKDDMVQLPRVLYNLDERKIPDPLTVDLTRPQPVPNATFGGGVHKCPGAILARSEIRVFLEEWLKRIPAFRTAPGFRKTTMGGGVNGIQAVDLIWDVP
jgi:cytochrome P450